jgi:hypothetical protein
MRLLPGYEMASNAQPYIVKTGFICAIVRFRDIIVENYSAAHPRQTYYLLRKPASRHIERGFLCHKGAMCLGNAAAVWMPRENYWPSCLFS